jgi:hypothetical protein
MYKYGKKLPGVDSAPTKMYSPAPGGFNPMAGQAMQPDMMQTPTFKMDPNYNGVPGVQKSDFEQFDTPANKKSLCPGCSSGCKKCRNSGMKKRGCGSKY